MLNYISLHKGILHPWIMPMRIKLKNSFSVVYLILLLLSAGCANNQKSAAKTQNDTDELDVYLLIGQSNMQGVAPIENLDTITLENVYLFNDEDKWELARNYENNGINRYSTVKKKPITLLGPGYTFGRKISKISGKKIGIVSNARGATRIGWWQKGYDGERGDYDLYEEAVKRTKAALASNPKAKLKGILWHQGEANNGGGRHIGYMEDLQKLVSDLRADFGDSEIPFIAGEVGKWNNRGLNINPIIRTIKDNISHTEWVSSNGLTTINLAKNDAHFDNLSQRVFGGRYADKVALLVYDKVEEGVHLYSKFNFMGRSVLLGAGAYSPVDLERMGIHSKEIASAKIDKGYELILNSSTKNELLTETIDTIMPSQIDSIIITKMIK